MIKRDLRGCKPPDYCGSVYVRLSDQTIKSADFCIFDPTLARGKADINAAVQNACPTLVWEVGMSESARKLGRDCARWSGATEGRVRVAIGMKVFSSKVNTDPPKRIVDRIDLTKWTIRKFTENDKKVTRDQCGKLRWLDGKEDTGKTVPLAKRYKFSVDYDTYILTWKVGRARTTVSSPSTWASFEGDLPLFRFMIKRTQNPSPLEASRLRAMTSIGSANFENLT